MIRSENTGKRSFPGIRFEADLVITGGGLSGVCCAITAARQGLQVILVQDRPVLGGNSSSEVRLWVLGATSHMGNNNRWAREGGVLDEILVENMYRNPEGNPVIYDSILLDKVVTEKNITLLLNTVVYEVMKKDESTISAVRAFCSQNQTEYELTAPLFCDASGDGVTGFLSGAAFRMGAESKEEFGEGFAPSEEYGELLGHSLYFYTKDTGRPVSFVPPAFALDDITQIPRFRSFNTKEYGCRLWWIEYGGRLDTVHDTETIKWELWKIVYGVWNHIKNSGQFPEAENLTLEWVGMIPGKRESRRFEGDYILKQQDIIEQRVHEDAVAFGGWSVDLHPADGVYATGPGCNQWHSKGTYQIPYRCLYSRNINNLLLAGRIISASHVAFGSSRVMGTAAYAAQAVGMAAVLCKKYRCRPAELFTQKKITELQRRLMQAGQYIPHHLMHDEQDLVQLACIHATSELELQEIPEDGGLLPLDLPVGQMVPVKAGKMPDLVLHAYTDMPGAILEVEVRISSNTGNYTPDRTLARFELLLQKGRNCLPVQPGITIAESQYVFVILHRNPAINIPRSAARITGILSVFNTINPAVSNFGKQEPPAHIGMDSFEFWCPQRRPAGQNIAIKFKPALSGFGAANLRNGIARPTLQPNAWVADPKDHSPAVELRWEQPQTIKKIVLTFDTDYDHPMESVLMGHPERVMPFCVRRYKILDDKNEVVYECSNNYQTINTILPERAISTRSLRILMEHPSAHTPAALFEVRCYGE